MVLGPTALNIYEALGGNWGTLPGKDEEIWVRMGKFILAGLAWAHCDNWRVW